jgi:hypothetical protein
MLRCLGENCSTVLWSKDKLYSLYSGLEDLQSRKSYSSTDDHALACGKVARGSTLVHYSTAARHPFKTLPSISHVDLSRSGCDGRQKKRRGKPTVIHFLASRVRPTQEIIIDLLQNSRLSSCLLPEPHGLARSSESSIRHIFASHSFLYVRGGLPFILLPLHFCCHQARLEFSPDQIRLHNQSINVVLCF